MSEDEPNTRHPAALPRTQERDTRETNDAHEPTATASPRRLPARST